MGGREQKSRDDRRRDRESLAWYVGMNLMVGQFLARVFADIPFNTPFLIFTGVLVVVPLYGRRFFIELIRAVRGSESDTGGSNDDAE